jgi:hypothetical protein
VEKLVLEGIYNSAQGLEKVSHSLEQVLEEEQVGRCSWVLMEQVHNLVQGLAVAHCSCRQGPEVPQEEQNRLQLDLYWEPAELHKTEKELAGMVHRPELDP